MSGLAPDVIEDVVSMPAKTSRKAFGMAAGKETQIGKKILGLVDDLERVASPARIGKALDNMPPVNIGPTLMKAKMAQAQVASRYAGSAMGDQAVQQIQNNIVNLLSKNYETYNGMVPARQAWEMRKIIDDLARYGTVPGALPEAAKVARVVRKDLADELLTSALASNNPGYVKVMRDAHNALTLRDELLGRTTRQPTQVAMIKKGRGVAQRAGYPDIYPEADILRQAEELVRQVPTSPTPDIVLPGGVGVFQKGPPPAYIPSDITLAQQARAAALARALGMHQGQTGVPWLVPTKGAPSLITLAQSVAGSPKATINLEALARALKPTYEAVPKYGGAAIATTKGLIPGVTVTVPPEGTE